MARAAALSLVLLGMAQAAVITQSKAFGLVSGQATRTEQARGIGGAPLATVSPQISLNQALSFNRFDASLGTLTSVTFWLLSPMGQDVLMIDNFGGDGGRVTASGSVNRLLSGVPGLVDIGLASPVTLGCNEGGDPSACTANFANTPPATAFGGQALAVAGFVGAGAFNIAAGLKLDAPTLAYELPPDCGTVTTSLSSSWSGTVKIDYAYTQAPPPPSGVPEPASLYLTAAALLAAGWLRRRRTA